MKTITFVLLLLSLFTPNTAKSAFLNGAIDKTVSIKVYAIDIDFFTEKLVVNEYGGSGVFISSTGWILSCSHLFLNRTLVVEVTTSDGKTYLADDVKVDFHRDLSLIKVSPRTRVPYAKLADSNKVSPGQVVYAVGTPLGLDFTVTRGIISYAHRQIGKFKDLLQTDAAINPGNSGGPLFNKYGELLGINIFIVSQTSSSNGLGFAVTSNVCKQFIEETLNAINTKTK